MTWRLVYSRHAQKDARKIAKSSLKERALALLKLIEENPFQTPPPFERLIGDLSGACSRRINIQHRLVYQVLAEERVVKVIRMWTHYE